jgi:hypothetical protein
MSERIRLPNKHASTNFSIEVSGMAYTATASFIPGTNRLYELFLNNQKSGSMADTNARDAAILLSFAIQYGAPIEPIRRALCRDADGNALGPVAAALDLISNDDGGTP